MTESRRIQVTEPLTQTDVDALPDGTSIVVTWTGGNGPHEYVVRVVDGKRYAVLPVGHPWRREDEDTSPCPDALLDSVGPCRTVVRLSGGAAWSGAETRARRRVMSERIWILGAPDPEMEAIEQLLRECGETVAYAANERGERLVGAAAYWGESLVTDAGNHPCTSGVTTVYLVECDLLTPGELAGRTVRRIDHHAPGDPGYGRPPAEFLEASSIGQVVRELARIGAIPSSWRRMAAGRAAPLTPQHADGVPVDYTGLPWLRVGRDGEDAWDIVLDANTFARVPRELVLIAAADHCLGAAYRGECPGVDPDALMRWRAESRAKFQGRSVDDVLADVERAKEALMRAPLVSLGGGVAVRDMRDAYTVRTVLVVPFADGATVDAAGVGDSVTIEFGACEGAWDEGGHHTFVRRGVPELPEAAARLGAGYVSGPLKGPDGRQKITCSGTPDQVRAFLDHWAPAQGLVDAYGDPQRGFAGAYLPASAA